MTLRVFFCFFDAEFWHICNLKKMLNNFIHDRFKCLTLEEERKSDKMQLMQWWKLPSEDDVIKRTKSTVVKLRFLFQHFFCDDSQGKS